ncbi:MAG: hypothetical protein PHG23_00850 [Candidatus Pacebacteria bacterium]|nr:hypothetical protein [Candidatus Paceibacterota bacterium]
MVVFTQQFWRMRMETKQEDLDKLCGKTVGRIGQMVSGKELEIEFTDGSRMSFKNEGNPGLDYGQYPIPTVYHNGEKIWEAK